MPPTVDDRLHDIREAIIEIEKMTAGVDFVRFGEDRIMRLATERLLEIVCEASRSVPDHVKNMAPAIHWRRMIDFGNLLRHAYHSTEAAEVWDIVVNELPPLKTFVSDRLSASE